MTTYPKLCDYAAERLCEGNPEEGHRIIKSIVMKLYILSEFKYWTQIPFLIFGAFIVIIMLIIAQKTTFYKFDLHPWQYIVWLISLLIGITLIIFSSISTDKFQNRNFFLTSKNRYDVKVPDIVIDILDDILTGDLNAIFSDCTGSSTVDRDYIIIDGHSMNKKITSEMLNNRYAPLLLSNNIKYYNSLFNVNDKPFSSFIYLVKDTKLAKNKSSIEIKSDEINMWWIPEVESENKNNKKEYNWLVNGTFEQFQIGFLNFINDFKIIDNKAAWIKINLYIARFLLRQGDKYSREETIKYIRVELVKKYNSLSISGRESDSLEITRALLRGFYNKKSIKSFFVDEYSK